MSENSNLWDDFKKPIIELFENKSFKKLMSVIGFIILGWILLLGGLIAYALGFFSHPLFKQSLMVIGFLWFARQLTKVVEHFEEKSAQKEAVLLEILNELRNIKNKLK